MSEIWDSQCSRFQKPLAVIPLQLRHLQYTQPYWSAENDFTPYLLLSLLDILDTPQSWSLWDLEVFTATLPIASPDLTQWQVSVILYGPFNPTFSLPPKPMLEGTHPCIVQFRCQLEMQPWYPLSHRVLTPRKCFLEIFTSVMLVSS